MLPLSPVLFALAMELLALYIRQATDIKGIEKAGIKTKISLFADDILLTISSPHTSLPNILQTLCSFAAISRLHVNDSKSQALDESLTADSASRFKSNFVYLDHQSI